MKLEIISLSPDRARRGPPLLFVHGAFSCARVWEPFFLPFFAERGYHCHALSLRGHGRSKAGRRLVPTRLRDYVADVEEVIGRLGTVPVLIGTSMGGVVIQHLMQRQRCPAVVLMASGPPHGMVPSMVRMVATNPLLVRDMSLMLWLGPGMATLDGARRALFRPETSAEYILRHLPPAQPEPPMVMLDLMGLDLPPSIRRDDVPVLVLGAERDAFISPTAVHETARTFGTRAEIVPGMAHAMMLDEGWREVAERILSWLDTVLPADRGEPARPPAA